MALDSRKYPGRDIVPKIPKSLELPEAFQRRGSMH